VAKSKAVLIIGGSGFVGTHLALRLRDNYKVFATYNHNRVQIRGVTLIPLALHNRDWAKRVVYLARPEVIIYVAGSNSVEWSEANSREVEHIHTGGAATISNVSDILQPHFIYLSNSYIFDGVRGNYHENDIVLPTTTLGKGKLGGENFIRSKSLTYAIIRSSPLLGRGNGYNPSLLDRLRIALGRGERIDLPNEELHNFGLINGLVELVVRVIESGSRKKTYHYGGLTKMTHYELGVAFAERFGFNSKLIVPARNRFSSSALETAVQDYSLNFSQAVESLKIEPLFLEQSFDLLDKNLIPRP